MDIIGSARGILGKGYVCDNCLGRQFAQILTGCTNKERGKALRLVLAMQNELEEQKVDPSNFAGYGFRSRTIEAKKATCCVCDGIFDSLLKISRKMLKEIEDLEYDSFHVGVRLSEKLLKNEEALWESAGIECTESIKKELSRETGKIIQKKTKKEVDLNNPDIVVLLNLEKNAIEVTINPSYIYGKYKKYVKIPQTKHYCPECHGSGCDKCNWRGLSSPTSVQQMIAEPLLEATEGVDTKFHGQGREDVDVLCLGWRPFVIEVIEPRKRYIDLRKLRTKINKLYVNKIEVDELRFCDKKEVLNIKGAKPDKTYLLVLKPEKPISEKELIKLDELVGVVRQRTPERVKHRRADIERKRKVYSVKSSLSKEGLLKIELKTEAGLYIKELATGDGGRTKPSVADVLGTKVDVRELTVLKVG